MNTKEIIKKMAPFVATDNTRPELTYIKTDGKVWEATDAYSLCRLEFSKTKKTKEEFIDPKKGTVKTGINYPQTDVIMPDFDAETYEYATLNIKFIEKILRVAKKATKDGVNDITIGISKISKNDPVTLYSAKPENGKEKGVIMKALIMPIRQ